MPMSLRNLFKRFDAVRASPRNSGPTTSWVGDIVEVGDTTSKFPVLALLLATVRPSYERHSQPLGPLCSSGGAVPYLAAPVRTIDYLRMAKMIPSDRREFHGSKGEERAFLALRSLPEDVTNHPFIQMASSR
jgi:hypothetical protein